MAALVPAVEAAHADDAAQAPGVADQRAAWAQRREEEREAFARRRQAQRAEQAAGLAAKRASLEAERAAAHVARGGTAEEARGGPQGRHPSLVNICERHARMQRDYNHGFPQGFPGSEQAYS